VNKLDAYIDGSILALTLPMLLPTDVLFYNDAPQQQLLYAIAGIIGLVTWCPPPPPPPPPPPHHPPSPPGRYASLGVLLLCMRLDMRGKGVLLPDWLQAISMIMMMTIIANNSMHTNSATVNMTLTHAQFRLHRLLVPRYEAQLARLHALIERAEAKEVQLLQVPVRAVDMRVMKLNVT
jgi:hypothetical protein